jgi:superfamily II DNA or RNA helicase
MPDTQQSEHPIFTDEDRVRLQQLLTLRAMAERRSREAASEGSAAPDESEPANHPAAEIPARWRLVPNDITLHDWQRECLPLWLSKGRGTVKVATGGGKTLFALAAAQELQNEREFDLRLVVVVPTIPLMFQWYDEIREGNLPASAIGLMGGGQELPPLYELRILICVLNSARERLPELVKKAGWSDRILLVVDECHRSAAEQARRIYDTNPKYTLGLSATPEQELEADVVPTDEAYAQSVVGQALGPIICEFTLKQSLEAGLLTPFEVWHVGLPLTSTEAAEHARMSREIADLKKPLQAGHRQSRSKQHFLAWCQTQMSRGGRQAADATRFIGLSNGRKRLLYRAKARTDAALSLLSDSCSDLDGRAIVFHESIEEIESLFLEALEVGLPVVLEHSQLPDSLRADNIEAFRRGVARAIISAKSLVEGFNVPSADLGIIAASNSSPRQRIQSLGRMLRRKKSGRGARVIVLYIRDTQDEAIYEKADWKLVVGAERNRYFRWRPPAEGEPWAAGLQEVAEEPRPYRPPSFEIDASELSLGDPYSAQASGLELKVDQAGNLRTEDGLLVQAPRELVEAIVSRNPYRRARRTPAGHLIVRVDASETADPEWLYLGLVDPPQESSEMQVTRLKLRRLSGKRVIALEEGRKKDQTLFALGPGSSSTPEAGEARDRLLNWIRAVEAERGVEAKELFWDNQTSYWLEIEGERIPHNGSVAPLEFKL